MTDSTPAVEVLTRSEVRATLKRHGLAWNFYTFPSDPQLFWPNGSVSHPATLADAIEQVAIVDSRWFNQMTLGERPTRLKWSNYDMRQINAHCDCPVAGDTKETHDV